MPKIDFTGALLKYLDGGSGLSGDAIIRAGSVDYQTWQVVEEDKATAVDISLATAATLRLENRKTKTTTEFSTADTPQKLFISDAANGKIQLRPTASDFSEAAYYFHMRLTDATGSHPVPEDRNYSLRVIDDYAP